MDYNIIKSIHVVFVVSWFAGLLYLVRLFVYHAEALQKPDPAREILHTQFSVMERRLLLGITLPAALITVVTGVILLIQSQAYMQPWFHLKALLVVFLLAYTHLCGKWRKELAAMKMVRTSKYFRIQNEVATFLLIGIVFAVTTKNPTTSVIAMLAALALGLVLFKIFAMAKQKRSGK